VTEAAGPGQERTRAHVRITGRVQGVGFRFAVAREARARGVTGWVRNLETGQVEAVFEGAPEAVSSLVAWCRAGPPGAWVRDVACITDEPPEGFAVFEIRVTTFG
jgi:acylphosphatase